MAGSLLTEAADMVELSIDDIGDMPRYFVQRCVEATKKNIKLVLQKLANPSEIINVQLSGSLADAASGGAGALGSFAKNYIKRNAGKMAKSLASSALSSAQKQLVEQTLGTVYRWVSMLYLANNNLVFIMMKIVARTAIDQLGRKDIRLNDLKTQLQALYNTLLVMSAGDPILNEYVESLKKGMSEVDSARTKIKLTYNTLESRNIFLSRAWKEAQTHLRDAQHFVRPSTGDNPYTGALSGNVVTPNGTGPWLTGAYLIQGETAGFIPTTKEQFDNYLAVPIITWEATKTMRDYAALTLSINGILTSFKAGVSKISIALIDKLRQNMLEQIDILYNDTDALYKEMKETITPRQGVPSPIRLTANAFKWSITLHYLNSAIMIIPTSPIEQASRSLDDVDAYSSAVKALKSLGTIKAGSTYTQTQPVVEPDGTVVTKEVSYKADANLIASESIEDSLSFERQILTCLLQANSAVINHEVAQKALPLIKAALSRVNLGLSRNAQIRGILESYINHTFEGEEALAEALDSVQGIFKSAGLDRVSDALKTGDWTTLFNVPASAATYVGAGLAAISALKDCFKGSSEEQEKLTKYQRKMEQEKDLLNIKISFDLDLEILKNIDVCLDAKSFTEEFSAKSLFCKIAGRSGVGEIFKALDSMVSISDIYDNATAGVSNFVDTAGESASGYFDEISGGSGI